MIQGQSRTTRTHRDHGTLWVGEQLEKRLRLCTFIADQIESDMKEVQNESQQ